VKHRRITIAVAIIGLTIVALSLLSRFGGQFHSRGRVVHLGDTREQVVEKLGFPESTNVLTGMLEWWWYLEQPNPSRWNQFGWKIRLFVDPDADQRSRDGFVISFDSSNHVTEISLPGENDAFYHQQVQPAKGGNPTSR
jgi:outer membrane protein assembly factor BamE (lipoprotein component of BamABCDE complex)